MGSGPGADAPGPGQPTDGEWLSRLETASGGSRQVGAEEYEFFYKMVRRDSGNRGDEEALEAETKDFINRQNAMFYLAELSGLTEPYSFEALQKSMEEENQRRKKMKENGETFYGLEQFDLDAYYQYLVSNLRLDILDYMVDHATEQMRQEGRSFFEQNLEDYQSIASVTYQEEIGGAARSYTISYEELRALQWTDSELFDFLLTAGPGLQMQTERLDGICTTTFVSVEKNTPTFEEAYGVVMKDFVYTCYYNDLLDIIADNNPVRF